MPVNSGKTTSSRPNRQTHSQRGGVVFLSFPTVPPTSTVTQLMRLSLLLGSLLLIFGCGSSADEETNAPPPGARGNQGPPAVEAVQARYGSLPLEERMSGTVRARNQVEIFPEIDAPVEAVEAETGEYVEQGEVLVRLQDDQYRERVRQAQASLRIARAEAKSANADLKELRSQLKRTERLAEQEFESQQQLESLRAKVERAEAQYERAQAQVEQAQATLDERQADLQRTIVRAPISGYVGAREVEIGQRVGSNTRLYTLGDLDTVRVRIEVTDRMFGQIQTGQTARIHVPSEDTVLSAPVTRMSPFLSDETHSAQAEIDVSNEDGLLQPGMFVEVDVLYGESRQATLIPLSALYQNPNTGERGVFVAPTLGTEIPVEEPESYDEDNPPEMTQATPTTFREVKILAEGRMRAGVRGIEPGDWVITTGQNLLTNQAADRVDARVRPLPWSRIVSLQQLQDRDLLRQILERQQEMAEERFASNSSSESDTSSLETDQDASPES